MKEELTELLRIEVVLYPALFFYSHEQSFKNDLCLLFPEQPFQFNFLVAPLDLGDRKTCRIGAKCQVSGFGDLAVSFKLLQLYLIAK